MSQEIIPIIIIGSARNGTTNLENVIASLPSVVGVEHWLHHGSQESNIHTNQCYWGDLGESDQYIHFLYQYASSDYFQLCKGNVQYHLEHPRQSFYLFFLDLMDRYALKEEKKHWVTKLDPCFFYDDKQRAFFLSLLHERYPTVKFIRIQRSFGAAFNSYRNMEGAKYRLRQNPMALLPALVYQACRYTLIYGDDKDFRGNDYLRIPFKAYIKDRKKYLTNITDFLGISLEDPADIDINRFPPNTSFGTQPRKELPAALHYFIPALLKFLRTFPPVARIIWKTYYRTKASAPPIFRRLLKYKYFRKELINELTNQHAKDLVKLIKEKSNKDN